MKNYIRKFKYSKNLTDLQKQVLKIFQSEIKINNRRKERYVDKNKLRRELENLFNVNSLQVSFYYKIYLKFYDVFQNIKQINNKIKKV